MEGSMTRPWLAHYDAGVPQTLAPYPERTLLDYLTDTAREHGDRAFLLFKGATATYAQLERESDAFAAALVDQGVRRGDRVAIGLPNCPQFFVAELGAWKIGAIACPFNPTYTEREIQDALVTTGATTLVVLNRFYKKVKDIQAATSVQRIIVTNIKEYLPFLLSIAFTLFKEKKEGDRITLTGGDLRLADVLRAFRGKPRPSVTISPSDPAVILMSGGTTGKPKGVLGLHGSMVIAGLQLKAWLSPAMREWDDTIHLPLPLFHTYGNTGVQSLALVNHNPIALVPNPRDIGDMLRDFNKVKPAFTCAVPTLLNAIMNHPMVKAKKVDFSSLKLCFSGAAALMAETKKRFEELTGCVIVEGYSLTEAQMAVVANPVLGARKVGSVGMPLPDVDVRIVDADNGITPMPLSQVGEIVIRARQITPGYWNDPAASSEMLRADADGTPLLFTGDLGYLDEDGYLFIVDRKKDLIKTSGFQVWPREIEEVISAHPAVLEVGVVGIPDKMRGESVKAWIVLRPNTKLDAAELKAWCRERLAPYKVPAEFEFVSDLPKSQVGKVLRRLLRQEPVKT
jgi:long-chain acyl-CoA synthetase